MFDTQLQIKSTDFVKMNGTIMMCSSESTAQFSATVLTIYVTQTKYRHEKMKFLHVLSDTY